MNKLTKAVTAAGKDPARMDDLLRLLARSQVVFGLSTDPITARNHLLYIRSVSDGEDGRPETVTEYIPFFPSRAEALSADKALGLSGAKFEYAQRPAVDFFMDALALRRPCVLNPHDKNSMKLNYEEIEKVIRFASQPDRRPEALTDKESKALNKKIEEYLKAKPAPQSLAELIDMAASCLDSRLLFHPRVKESVQAYSGHDSPEIRGAAWSMFVGLSSSLYPMARKKNISESRFFEENGIALVMVETPPPDDQVFIDSRTARYLDRSITFYSYLFHPKYFDWSLHFHILKDHRILVCYLGKTLPSRPLDGQG
jgi:hypothetical protein